MDYSTRVVFDDSDFIRSHGRKPRTAGNWRGWAFKVYDWDGGNEVIWTRGASAREVKAEIAARVRAPKGVTVCATFQP